MWKNAKTILSASAPPTEILVNKTCTVQQKIRLKTIAFALSLSFSAANLQSFWLKHCWSFVNGILQNAQWLCIFLGGRKITKQQVFISLAFLTIKLVPINQRKTVSVILTFKNSIADSIKIFQRYRYDESKFFLLTVYYLPL